METYSKLLSVLSLFCFFSTGYPDEPKIKGMFVFGSSLVDNGNNNFLQNSMARANYWPYGIDFPLGASGRFTNGKNVIDLLGDQLHLPSLIPPFNDPFTKGRRVLRGVNYASGGSGILDDTGIIVAGNVTSLNQQIRNFERVTLPDLESQLENRHGKSISNYLFVVGTGGNDYTLNYFLTKSTTSLEDFTANLIDALSGQLKKLHSLGGRKFILMGVYPLGCYPVMKATLATTEGCLKGPNRAAELFNSRLKSLMDLIKPQMPGSNLIFVNTYKIVWDIINEPVSKGFKDANTACCEVTTRAQGGSGAACRSGGRVCEDRNTHVFFDGLHPTEAVNYHIATKAYASKMEEEVYPINVKQIANICSS